MPGMDLNQNTQDYERDRMMERINEHERVLNGLTLETVKKIPGVDKLMATTLRVVRGNLEKIDGEEIDIESDGGAIDWTKVMFGYQINPDGDNALEVRIMAGRIGAVVVAQTDHVLPSADGDYYVWVRRQKSNDAVVIQSGAAWPEDDATYAYYVLHRFTVADESASIMEVIRPLLRDRLQVDGTGLQYQVFQVDGTGAIIVDWLRAGP